MKDLCAKYGIPTAAYGRFTDAKAAKDFIRRKGAPIVVKADGLAAGKGVIIAETVAEAEAAVDSMLTGGQFGEAGEEVVIEEFLAGEEASFFALVDGETALPLASPRTTSAPSTATRAPTPAAWAPIHRRRSLPTPCVAEVMRKIIEPTVAAMKARGPAVQGRAVCRADADRRRTEAARIQCPLRRSRMPGADACA